MSSPKRKFIAKNSQSFNGKPYMFSGGNWGEYIPKYSISKIMKINSKTYDVTMTNRLCAYGTSKSVKLGTTTMRIVLNPKSSYKYKVTKLSYKGTGAGYF